jgi:hypothetical protein
MCRLVFAVAVSAASLLAADWNPKLAAGYLDSRQKEWFVWPRALASTGSPCISCHTGVTYLLARPELRRALGQSQPTEWERGYLNTMRERASKSTAAELYPKAKDPSAGASVESIFSALFLALDDAPAKTMSPATRQAFDRLWSLQIRDGKAKGRWAFYELDSEPWEMSGESPYFGAVLAALAVGATPPEYRNQAAVRDRIAELADYLRREQVGQPLHNRIMLLWASTAMPEVLTADARKAILDDLWRKQQPDGGWTNESMGPYKQGETAPPSPGSSGYPTAFTAFVLERIGTQASNPGLARALNWLRTHQDRNTGYWDSVSMNRPYPPDSMPSGFMRDAATSFAALALIESGDAARSGTESSDSARR